ncbi:DinB family protein [Anaerosporobacter faecicola]|uniref:DinB family protein n=1 Tax=Anaerosporobacter faecicola TaxID=2718714 RepID=UPI00143B4C65|nr:DinB family protein [Anaerosporobacter faecicola]
MKYFGNELSPIHKDLSGIIRKPDQFQEARQLFLNIHGELHSGVVSGKTDNQIDALKEGLTDEQYAIMPTKKDETIAWVIWHIARIEDLTMNILMMDKSQVFDKEWNERLGVSVCDTGNAWSDQEIIAFSKQVDKKELWEYRNEVGRQTRENVMQLSQEDCKRKVSKEGLERIRLEGGVTNQEESIWLLDFWGKKDMAGLLLMPPTRHVILHLNDCFKWKEQMKTKHQFYLK